MLFAMARTGLLLVPATLTSSSSDNVGAEEYCGARKFSRMSGDLDLGDRIGPADWRLVALANWYGLFWSCWVFVLEANDFDAADVGAVVICFRSAASFSSALADQRIASRTAAAAIGSPGYFAVSDSRTSSAAAGLPSSSWRCACLLYTSPSPRD